MLARLNTSSRTACLEAPSATPPFATGVWRHRGLGGTTRPRAGHYRLDDRVLKNIRSAKTVDPHDRRRHLCGQFSPERRPRRIPPRRTEAPRRLYCRAALLQRGPHLLNRRRGSAVSDEKRHPHAVDPMRDRGVGHGSEPRVTLCEVCRQLRVLGGRSRARVVRLLAFRRREADDDADSKRDGYKGASDDPAAHSPFTSRSTADLTTGCRLRAAASDTVAIRTRAISAPGTKASGASEQACGRRSTRARRRASPGRPRHPGANRRGRQARTRFPPSRSCARQQDAAIATARSSEESLDSLATCLTPREPKRVATTAIDSP